MAKKSTKPLCVTCHEKPVRKGSYFCSQKCAAEWADELYAGNENLWCEVCQEWDYKGNFEFGHQHNEKENE